MTSKESFNKIYNHLIAVLEMDAPELIRIYKHHRDMVVSDLEILEIIKKHKPSFFRLDFCKTASHYNKIYEDGTCPKIMNYKILSEEEFDLLKEWLNEDKS